MVMLVVVVIFVLAGVAAAQAIAPILGFDRGKDYPGPGGEQVVYELKRGASPRTVATDLKSQDVVASERAFVKALSEAKADDKLIPGSYPLRKQMKASDAVQVLLQATFTRVHYAPIPQNLRQEEVFEKLHKSTGIPASEFADLAKSPQQFGLPPQAPSLEGYLAPGEYRFPVDVTARQILTEMVKRTMEELAKAGVQGADNQYRVLTLASIIEAEGQPRYYAAIAGAMENRLNNPSAETGGRLESDATVSYGLGRKSYNITSAEKADTSNPYNTFAKKGLPVGPIGSPKMQAILAAATPEKNSFYFWVTVNLDTGETLFAKTFAEHQQNVAKYSQWCSAHPGRCS